MLVGKCSAQFGRSSRSGINDTGCDIRGLTDRDSLYNVSMAFYFCDQQESEVLNVTYRQEAYSNTKTC